MHYLLIEIYFKDIKVGKIKEKITYKYELSSIFPPHKQGFLSSSSPPPHGWPAYFQAMVAAVFGGFHHF